MPKKEDLKWTHTFWCSFKGVSQLTVEPAEEDKVEHTFVRTDVIETVLKNAKIGKVTIAKIMANLEPKEDEE